LEKFGAEECKNKGVVIGYDGRYNSKGYAHISAAVFKHFNVKCLLFEEYVCTPLIPYAVVKYNCLAGIMVTASHNPKKDNGYKVYWTNGAQIIEPHDKGIREQIEQNLAVVDVGEYFNYETQLVMYKLEALRDKTMSLYFEDALNQITINPKELNAKCKPIVHTSMHGVGHIFFNTLIQKLGFKEPIPVKEQMMPDPEFPTVVYPNPEEGEGSLNLSFKTADSNGSSVILANDPDADRLAVAEKQRE
jgi:phosphoglucomutase